MTRNNKLNKRKRVIPPTRLVRQVINSLAERKVFSLTNTSQTISNTGTIISLSNGIIEGDDLFNRSGTKIRALVQTLKFRFTAVTSSQSARFVLFRDMFNAGSIPTVAEILPTVSFQSHYSDVRQLQQRRYSILHDETIDCSINGEAVKSAKPITVRKPGVVHYNGATAIATANGSGAIFMVVIGSHSNGVYDYDWQMVFNDS